MEVADKMQELGWYVRYLIACVFNELKYVINILSFHRIDGLYLRVPVLIGDLPCVNRNINLLFHAGSWLLKGFGKLVKMEVSQM